MAHLQRGQIVLVNVVDPQGRNPKDRPVVILTPTEEINAQDPIFAIAITGTIEKPLPKSCIQLPWHRRRHSRTGLSKPSVARCDWFVWLRAANVTKILGVVPENQLQQILDALGELPL